MESAELLKLQEMIDSIISRIDEITVPQTEEPTSSYEKNELFTALSKAQGEMALAENTHENSYFKSKYSDLSSIIQTSRKPLSNNGLAVIQCIVTTDGAQQLQSILGHSSGQWISSNIPLNPPKNDVETLGSYLAYIKRHSYAALVGIASREEDDDGEISMVDERKKVTRAPINKYKMERESYESITKEQREEVEYELERHPNPESVVESIYKAYRINSLANIPKSKFLPVITKIREVVNAEAEAKTR